MFHVKHGDGCDDETGLGAGPSSASVALEAGEPVLRIDVGSARDAALGFTQVRVSPQV